MLFRVSLNGSLSNYEEVLNRLDLVAKRQRGKIIYSYIEKSLREFQDTVEVRDLDLPDSLVKALESYGIRRLYRFQVEALERYREGKDIVIVAGTGTGKTEAFTIPLLEDMIKRKEAFRKPYALLVYPTKALARDQYIRLKRLAEGHLGYRVAVLDGDTPRDERARIYSDPPHILVTNPDMIHYGLIHSQQIRRLLSNAQVLVLDEMHVYKGIFGTHVKWVVYRLQRLTGELRFIGAGATIGNPEELGSKLFGRRPQVIEGPRRRKGEAIHALLSIGSGSRWTLAAAVISVLTRMGLKTLAFVDSQQMAELVARISRRSYGVKIGVHRAGLPAEYRKKVEDEFREGDLMAVVATPTMELGIDLGDLDAVLMVNLPHSFSSYLQRAGRAGRRDNPGLIVTLLGDSPIEAYFMRRPGEFFKQSPDPSYIEPSNKEIARLHLTALVMQEGLVDRDTLPQELVSVINEAVSLGLVKDVRGKLYPDWGKARQYIEEQGGLRSVGPRVKIMEDGRMNIGYREMPAALYDLYPGAIYYHMGRAYLSVQLDLNRMVAEVRRLGADVNFYTKPLYTVDVVEILPIESRDSGPLHLVYADVKLVVMVTGYVVREEYTGRKLYVNDYKEPITWSYYTKALVTKYPNPGITSQTALISGYHALEHALIAAAKPVVGAADTDLGGVSYPSGHIVIYDSAPGGHGASRLVFERLERIHEVAEKILVECDCDDGCPKCVYSPYCGNNNMFLSRKNAYRILAYTYKLYEALVKPDREIKPLGKPLA